MWELLENLGFSSLFYSTAHTSLFLIPNLLIRLASVYSFYFYLSFGIHIRFFGAKQEAKPAPGEATVCNTLRFPLFFPFSLFVFPSIFICHCQFNRPWEVAGTRGVRAVVPQLLPVCLSVLGQRFCEIEPQVSQRELFSLSICKRFVTSFRTNLSGKNFLECGVNIDFSKVKTILHFYRFRLQQLSVRQEQFISLSTDSIS